MMISCRPLTSLSSLSLSLYLPPCPPPQVLEYCTYHVAHKKKEGEAATKQAAAEDEVKNWDAEVRELAIAIAMSLSPSSRARLEVPSLPPLTRFRPLSPSAVRQGRPIDPVRAHPRRQLPEHQKPAGPVRVLPFLRLRLGAPPPRTARALCLWLTVSSSLP